jgi:hypothetical protein
LAAIARKFQVGESTDPESARVEPKANGRSSFQMNPGGGEDLLNKKHPRPQRVNVQNEMDLSNADQMLVSIKLIGKRPDLGSSLESSRLCLMN